MKSYEEIAGDFSLWQEFVDTLAIEKKEDWEQRPKQEKIDFLVACFGTEDAEEDEF